MEFERNDFANINSVSVFNSVLALRNYNLNDSNEVEEEVKGYSL